jgi:leucyl-tRNA synthetase
MQRNWIGKSKGVSITFDVENSNKKIEVFTTRPDTIFGVSFLTIAPEYKEISDL